MSDRPVFGITQYHLTGWPDPEAQRLFDRAVWQMSRSAGMGDEPGWTVRRMATGGGGFGYFYGFIGGEANQWYPALYEG